MDLNRLTSTQEAEGAGQLDLALKQCPASLQMNMKAVLALTPRWGGSYERMAEYAAKAPIHLNPKLKVLAAVIENDKCKLEDDDNEALKHCDLALVPGPYWELLSDKATILLRLKRYDEALEALDKAIEQRPQKTRLHVLRTVVLRLLSRNEEADREDALVQALDPYDPKR